MPLRALAAAVLILGFNLALTARLFITKYTNLTGSIEAAYISISHQWMTHGVDLAGWWPLWYGGVPGQNTYPPLLHVLVAATGHLGGISAASAHHAVTAAMYCLGALTVFWLAWVLAGTVRAAATAGLLFSVTSASAWLIPNVRHDLGSIFRSRRLQILLVYGEGPHIMSMTLLPVAVILLHFALTRKRPAWVLAAACAMAAVVLTNWLGGFALAAAVFAYLLAYQRLEGWLKAAGIGVFAYALAVPWIPPSTLQAIRTNAQWIGGDFKFGLTNLLWLAALVCACALGEFALRRSTVSPAIRFSATFAMLMGAVTLLGEWFAINILPQPHRYHVEMEMALCLLAGGIVASLRPRWSSRAMVALILLSLPAAYVMYRHSRELFHAIDIRETSEYRSAKWIDANMDGRRIYVPGTVSFWLNSFTDTPQLGGGFAQGIVNNNLSGADFQILSGMNAGDREGQIAIDWLRALGVHAVETSGPKSTEYYKPFTNPAKFEGLLPALWRDGDDAIYAVPQRSASLARVIPSSAVVAAPPRYATETEVLAPYLAAIDDPALPDASWKWLSRSRARIETHIEAGQVVSVQVSFHPGWRATANGVPWGTRADGLSQLVLEPASAGRAVVDLVYDGGFEMRAATGISAMAFLFGLAWIAKDLLGRRRE